MNIILAGILVGLLIISFILLLIDKPPTLTGSSGTQGSASVTTTTVVPAVPAVIPATTTTTNVTTVATPLRPTPALPHQTRGGDLSGSIWGFVKGVFSLAVFLLIVGAFIAGVYGLGQWADQCRAGNSDTEVVTIRPGSSAVVSLNGMPHMDYSCPCPTKIEGLNRNGAIIPVRCNGRWVPYVIDSPQKKDNVEEYQQPIMAARFTSASRQSEEYQITVRRW